MLGDDPFTWSFHLSVVRTRHFSFLVYYESCVFLQAKRCIENSISG